MITNTTYILNTTLTTPHTPYAPQTEPGFIDFAIKIYTQPYVITLLTLGIILMLISIILRIVKSRRLSL